MSQTLHKCRSTWTTQSRPCSRANYCGISRWTTGSVPHSGGLPGQSAPVTSGHVCPRSAPAFSRSKSRFDSTEQFRTSRGHPCTAGSQLSPCSSLLASVHLVFRRDAFSLLVLVPCCFREVAISVFLLVFVRRQLDLLSPMVLVGQSSVRVRVRFWMGLEMELHTLRQCGVRASLVRVSWRELQVHFSRGGSLNCRADRGHHGGLKRPWPLNRGEWPWNRAPLVSFLAESGKTDASSEQTL